MTNILEVKNLQVDYIIGNGQKVRAVDGVSFDIAAGKALGLAGESGCGKSTVAYSLMHLHKPPALISGGGIFFNNQNILDMDEKALRLWRWRDVSMVFQSAMNCLNPVTRIEKQFYEIFTNHQITKDRSEARKLSSELLAMVGISSDRLQDYPHQFSGGMRQRVVIAMALALKPKLLILDEPTTALDTIVQRDILQEVFALKEKLSFSILFITHDISLMMEFCDEIAIMYGGKIVEKGPVEKLQTQPKHPYTYGLSQSFPSLTGEISRMEGIPGQPINLLTPPVGCRFADRCFKASDVCKQSSPPPSWDEDTLYSCHHPLERKHSHG